jgi:hypothetical protein
VKQRCVFMQFLVINDNLEVDARVLISNNHNGEESKTTGRLRERERVCVRVRVLQKARNGIGHKIDHWRKICGANVRLISEVIKHVANDVVPPIYIFSRLIYKQHLDLTLVVSPYRIPKYFAEF